MKLRNLLLAGVCALAVPAMASAQSTGISEGPYVGGQMGASWLNTRTVRTTIDNDIEFGTDWSALLEAGYRFGNGVRLGFEVGYSDHTVDDIVGGGVGRTGGRGDLNAWTYMGTATYEFATDSAIRPYLGIGLGMAQVGYDNVGPVFTANQFIDEKDSAWAGQIHTGVIYSVSPNVDLSLGYRYLDSKKLDYRTTATTATTVSEDYQNHSVMAGVRYIFGAAPAPMPVKAEPPKQPAPPPPPPPAPAQVKPITKNFMVFFDWDKSDLTEDAKQVLKNVVENAKTGKVATIEVVGHADTSGATDYNQRLSVRRAEAVREYLLANGMAGSSVAVAGRGETELLVKTPDGVREPSNRRAVIVFP